MAKRKTKSEYIDIDSLVEDRRLKREEDITPVQKYNATYLKKIQERSNILNKQKIPYTIRVSGSKYQLKSKIFKETAFHNSDMTNTDLQFVRKVKRHILKNGIHLKFLDQFFPSDIAYMDANPFLTHTNFDNVIEVDINEAYWKTAYILGIINEEIYEEGKKGTLKKYTRLVALGSLAKKEVEYNYDENGYVGRKEIRSTLTENVWYTICKRVSDVMQSAKVLLGDDYLFYWVDGIYFVKSKKNIEKLKKFFIQNGYTSKEEKTDKVAFGHKWFAVLNDDNSIKKEFSYSGIINRRISFKDAQNLDRLCKSMLKENLDIDLLHQDEYNDSYL